MIPTIIKADLLSQISPARAATPVSPVTAIPNLQSSLPDFTQGQKYQALVEAQLPNGSSKVLIGDKLLQMRLPENIQTGDQLELVFISRESKLKFMLHNNSPLLDSGNGKTSTSISPTGRFLGVLMQDAKVATTTPSLTGSAGVSTHSKAGIGAPAINTTTIGAGVGVSVGGSTSGVGATNIGTTGTGTGTTATATATATQALTSTTPILASTPINNTVLAGLLQKTIGQSGLFYESHQAQWVNGKNTLEKLQLEPQGKLTNNPALATTTSKASSEAGIPVHTQSLPLVQQQLSTLETGLIVWRGEIWSGQPLEWEIHEESPDESKDDETSRWKTQLRLSLPQLGDITATIILNTQGIRIKLNAATSETLKLLENNQQPLTTQLHSAGLKIQSVEIKKDVKE
ncbi:MAG: flagellar hook-length control protein FliK [Nitrosomonas sp.]|nr:flagellar hook-length control protein FliK [Nitrosomonas sp.]